MTTPPEPTPIGSIPDHAVLIAQAADLAQSWAATAAKSAALARYVQSIGSAGLGMAHFGTEDGQAFAAAVTLMSELGLIVLGTGTLVEPKDYAHLLAQLIGPDPLR